MDDEEFVFGENEAEEADDDDDDAAEWIEFSGVSETVDEFVDASMLSWFK